MTEAVGVNNFDLAVWYGKMPESNGRENWTALLHRKGEPVHDNSYTFARSEYPDRVRYEADTVRFLIGEIPDRPDLLSYDPNLHSGYVDPVAHVTSVKDAIACLVNHIEATDNSALLKIRDAWNRDGDDRSRIIQVLNALI